MSGPKETQVIKFLTNELRKEPFARDFNLASFDCMTRDELLQIFNDVLAQLDSNQHAQIIHEDSADTADRIMEFLRVLKHKPSMEDPVKYRDAIQQGRADIICPIMAWILEKKEALKTRAYLANFLIEIEIPDECLGDDEISETRRKYLNLIEEFKEVHKQHEKLKTGNNTCGLMNDMQNIEHDIECIRRRIEIARSKYSGYPDLPGILRQARQNRKARDKASELSKQFLLEEQKLQDAEDKIRSGRRILKDLIEKNGNRTGEGIVEALEETCEVLKYIVMEKIPSEMESNERCITAMRLVENDPPNSQQDLTELKMKTQMVKSELHALESRLIRKLHDGDLQQLREQADQLDKVRQLKSSKLSCILRELYMQRKLLEHRSLERSTKIPSGDGTNEDGTLSDEQYRLFMKQMRVKAGKYKQMRSELARLQNEVGILASTKFILEGEEKETSEQLMNIEARLGIQGFSEAQEKLENLSTQKAFLDETNRNTLYEMSCMSKELHDKIALKKLHLEPLIKELQSKRLSTQLLEAEYNKVKDQYDSAKTAAELDTCHYRAKLEQLSNAEATSNIELCRLKTEMYTVKTTLENMKEESEILGLGLGKESKGRGFKDKLLTKILEEERRSKALKDESDGIDDLCAQRKHQAETWSQLAKFMKRKLELLQER